MTEQKIIETLKERIKGNQPTISKKAGIDQGSLSKLINGHHSPKLSTLIKVAEAVRCTIVIQQQDL